MSFYTFVCPYSDTGRLFRGTTEDRRSCSRVFVSQTEPLITSLIRHVYSFSRIRNATACRARRKSLVLTTSRTAVTSRAASSSLISVRYYVSLSICICVCYFHFLYYRILLFLYLCTIVVTSLPEARRPCWVFARRPPICSSIRLYVFSYFYIFVC